MSNRPAAQPHYPQQELTMTRTALRRLTFALTFTMPVLIGAAAPMQTTASPDVATVRTLFFQRDWDSAAIEGAKAASPTPEMRAWTILSMTRGSREKDAIVAAEKMTAELPENGWASFALAGVRNYQGEHAAEAIQAAERALAKLPNNPDAIWMRALALTGDAKRRDEAIAFVDQHRAAVRNPAQLLAVKAYALYVQGSGATRDEAKLTAAFDTFAEARKIDPANVDAAYLAGTYLTGLRRGPEGFPLLKTAAAIAPNATGVQQAYWRALNSNTTMAADAKLAELQASIDAFLAKNGNRSGALYAASSIFGDLKMPARQKELEDIVLTKYADTIDAEWILAYRWRAVQAQKDDAQKTAYRATLQTYLDRPRHYHEGLLGEAFRNMADVMIADTTTKPDELSRVLDGMIEYETTNVHITHALVPVAMADHKVLLDKAETIARSAEHVLVQKVESQKEFYKDQGEYERAMSSMVALGHDALGWVLFTEDKVADAEKELLKSYNMNHENRLNLYHLGKFYETGKNLEKAEDYYVKGMGVSALGVNPSEAALKAVFDRKNTGGSFDAYLNGIREADRTRRRTTIMGERSAAPKVAPAFNLKTLDGKMVSLESLKGKVVAINFWGIWCGWCVHELPDYQKLYEQYKNDPDVVILTIDNDQNPNDVPPWMAEKKFSFPVLFDDGFVSKAGITAFPTTWFLDREGRMAFTKVGWSEKLIEEFAWRIDAIKK
jgi:thiol-disulfide isomerase/thioredoxin